MSSATCFNLDQSKNFIVWLWVNHHLQFVSICFSLDLSKILSSSNKLTTCKPVRTAQTNLGGYFSQIPYAPFSKSTILSVFRMRHSLVLLISPHKEIIQDDSVRLDSDFDELQGFYRLFQHELTVNEIPFENITILDRKERVNQVVSALEQHRKKIQAQNVSVENETCK